MRTTIDLPEELLRTAKALAENRHQTLSRVITDLAWKGLEPTPVTYALKNGFPILSPRPGSRSYGPEHIKELEELADLQEMEKALRP